MANAWYGKGIALDFQGRYEEAIEAFDKAIEIDPQFEADRIAKDLPVYMLGLQNATESHNATEWYIIGQPLEMQGKHAEAIEAYDEAIRMDPEFAQAWSDKGSALVELNRSEEAIEAYNKALEIDPQDAMTWYHKGLALASQGEYDESIKAFDKALEIDPQLESAREVKSIVVQARALDFASLKVAYVTV